MMPGTSSQKRSRRTVSGGPAGSCLMFSATVCSC